MGKKKKLINTLQKENEELQEEVIRWKEEAATYKKLYNQNVSIVNKIRVCENTFSAQKKNVEDNKLVSSGMLNNEICKQVAKYLVDNNIVEPILDKGYSNQNPYINLYRWRLTYLDPNVINEAKTDEE